MKLRYVCEWVRYSSPGGSGRTGREPLRRALDQCDCWPKNFLVEKAHSDHTRIQF